MKNKVFKIKLTSFKKHWAKILSVVFSILILGSYINTLAIGNPYKPGEIFDPNCTPTDVNCSVTIGPWFTSSSGIYHDESNVYVGSDTASISSNIGGGVNISNILEIPLNSTSSFDDYISITVNNDGNPVIASYINSDGGVAFNFIKQAYASGSNSELLLITCLDSQCSDGYTRLIDSDFYIDSGIKPFLKIGTGNLARIAYLADINDGSFSMRYAVCNNEECSDPEISTLVTDSSLFYGYSLSLDEDDNPYILYNAHDGDSGSDVVYLARYTGEVGDTCGEDIGWKCSIVTPADNNYSLSNPEDANGNLMFLDDITGYPHFITNWDGGVDFDERLEYFECNDIDCSTYDQTIIDNMRGYSLNYILNEDNNGNPIIIYNSNPDPDENPYNNNIMMAKYLGDGSGSGCISEDWDCSSIAGAEIDMINMSIFIPFAINFEIGTDNNLRISTMDTFIYSLGEGMDINLSSGFIKCLNADCSSSNKDSIYTISGMSGIMPIVSLALNSNNEMYLSYFDFDNESLKIDKEIISDNIIFNPNGNDFYSHGDVGVEGSLYLDNNMVSQVGVYLNNTNPVDNSYLLYNNNGNLYWNDNLIPVGGGHVASILYADEAGYADEVSYIDEVSYASSAGTIPFIENVNNATNVDYATSTGSVATEVSSATRLTTARTIYGGSFNGTANLTNIITSTYGGTGNGFTNFVGPDESEKIFTLPNASRTILTDYTDVTVSQGGTGLSTITANAILRGNGTSVPALISPGVLNNILTSNGTTWSSTALPTRTVAQGGTGRTTLTANSIVTGNGTTAVNLIAPSTSGNILASNGTNWISKTPDTSIINSSNLFSKGLTGTGSGVTTVTNSNFFGETAGSSAINASNSNFFGKFAGYNATSASNSNFFGYNAGSYQTSSAFNSNFFGYQAGYFATSASNSNSFGYQAGYNQESGAYSNFLGHSAGYGSWAYYSTTKVSNSIFIGNNVGYRDLVDNTANPNYWSILVGYNTSTGGYKNSILLGGSSSITSNTKPNQFMLSPTITEMKLGDINYNLSSLQGTTNSFLLNNGSNTLFWRGNPFPISIIDSYNLFSTELIHTGFGVTTTINSNFFGVRAGEYATLASNSNFFGYRAGSVLGFSGFYSLSSDSNFFGPDAGHISINSSNSNYFGYRTGYTNFQAQDSNYFGYSAGNSSHNASNSIFIGRQAGLNNTVNNNANYNDTSTFANTSILIGHRTSTGSYSNSIALGAYATNTAVNQFMIGSINRPINTTIWNTAGSTTCTLESTGLTCTSDENLKKDITDLELDTLDKLIKVRSIKYNWLDEENTTPKNIGFLAQDLELYFPELVSIDVNGNKSVNYANMTPILVEAIREMNLKVADLSSFDTDSVNSLGSLIRNFLGNENNWLARIFVKTVVADGAQIKDKNTGEYYCIVIKNGLSRKIKGECGSPVVEGDEGEVIQELDKISMNN